MTGGDGLFWNWSLLGVKKFKATPTKQDLCMSWGFLSKFRTSIPIIFKWETPLAQSMVVQRVDNFLPMPNQYQMDNEHVIAFVNVHLLHSDLSSVYSRSSRKRTPSGHDKNVCNWS